VKSVGLVGAAVRALDSFASDLILIIMYHGGVLGHRATVVGCWRKTVNRNGRSWVWLPTGVLSSHL